MKYIWKIRSVRMLLSTVCSCYWIDWNWANTENIRIGLVFAVLAQGKFLYCIDRFDRIKANKSVN